MLSACKVMTKQIQIKVVPRAKRSCIKEAAGVLKVYTTAPAVDGKANEAVITALAEYFSLHKRQIIIARGERSRIKTITVLDEN